jgi:Uma2 family endonuclease
VAFRIAAQLEAQLGLESAHEIGIVTDIGIRVPDAVWMPADAWSRAGNQTPLPFAADVCVEVMSPSNTQAAISRKAQAYLRAGAKEVIVVEVDGKIRYLTAAGEQRQSSLGITLNLEPGLFK